MSKKKSRSRPRSQSSKKTEQRSLVDVVVPFFGDVEFVEAAIQSVKEACGDISYKLIVVDNGSPDQVGREVFRKLEENGIEFRKIWLKNNMGYPGGVNAGVHAGDSPLVFILTADVVMDPGSIAHAVAEMDDPNIGVVGCKLIFPPGSQYGTEGMIQHAGLAMDLSANIFHIFLGWSADHPKVNIRREMYAITGAAFMTRRSLFLKVEGLNTLYGAGTYEDMEYCVRMKELGRKIVYAPKVSGTHHVGGSMVAGANKGGFALEQNKQLFMARCGRALEWDEWRYW